MDPTLSRGPGEIIKTVNGKKIYGSLILKKFCVTWKNTLDTVQGPSTSGPKSIRGLASLVFQGERDVGGAMIEQNMLLKMNLEKTQDSARFNIRNLGNNFERAEPTSDKGDHKDLTQVRPVNAAYFVKSCSSSGQLSETPDPDPQKPVTGNESCYDFGGRSICVNKMGLFFISPIIATINGTGLITGHRAQKLFQGDFSNHCELAKKSAYELSLTIDRLLCSGPDGLVAFNSSNRGRSLHGGQVYKKPVTKCSYTGGVFYCYTQHGTVISIPMQLHLFAANGPGGSCIAGLTATGCAGIGTGSDAVYNPLPPGFVLKYEELTLPGQ